MEHLLQKSKCSIFHNIFKYMIFQRHYKALLWSKVLKAVTPLTIIESRYEKTNNVAVCHEKTQISLGIGCLHKESLGP